MSNPPALRVNKTGWILPLAERRVTRLLLDFTFTLEFWAAGKATSVRIEAPFDLKTGKESTRVNPEAALELAPGLGLLHVDVRRAFAGRDGSLEIEFSNDYRIRVLASSDYEAWEVHLDDGTRMVSQPGGTVGVWSPET